MVGVDLVIPYWGEPELLELTVASVLAQTSDAWELTILDDGHPASRAEAMVAALGDPRIHFHRNPGNLGIVANFQQAIETGSQERVVVLGSDDLLLPTYVATVLDVVGRHPQAAIIQPGVQVIDADGRVYEPLADRVKHRLLTPRGGEQVLAGERLAASLLHGNWLYWPSLALRRADLAGRRFDPRFPVVLDLDLILRVVADGGSLVHTPVLAFQYRRHAASLSSETAVGGSRFVDERVFFGEVAARMHELGWDRAARAARWHVTSRAHALVRVPEALLGRQWAAARVLTDHALSRPGRVR